MNSIDCILKSRYIEIESNNWSYIFSIALLLIFIILYYISKLTCLKVFLHEYIDSLYKNKESNNKNKNQKNENRFVRYF